MISIVQLISERGDSLCLTLTTGYSFLGDLYLMVTKKHLTTIYGDTLSVK